MALEERVRRVTARLAACRTRQEELSGDAGRLTARLDSARGDDPTLTDRLARLNDEAELLRDALEAARAARAAVADRESARSEAAAAALEAGFAGIGDAGRRARSESERDGMTEPAAALDARAGGRRACTLADPELVAARGRRPTRPPGRS